LKLSVIVPVFNAAQHLPRCIEALLCQDIAPSCYEILMVDNRSTDASAAIIRTHPEITLLYEPQQGPYAARNRALREARGEIIAFTDADCVPERDWLCQILRGMDAPEARILLGRTRPAVGSRALAQLGEYEAAKDAFALAGNDPHLYYGHAGNMAVRRAVFEESGGFAGGRRGEDTVLVQQVIAHYACTAVRYEARMRVTHLEWSSLWGYYKKLFHYAASQRRYGSSTLARALTQRERWHVYRGIARHKGLGSQAVLLASLAAGWLVWSAGAASAARI